MASGFVLSEGTIGSAQLAADQNVQSGDVLGLKADGYTRKMGAGDTFAGHAREAKNSTGKADGDVRVRKCRGEYFALVTIAGIAVANIGDTVKFNTATGLYELVTGEDVGTITDVQDGKAVVRFSPTV